MNELPKIKRNVPDRFKLALQFVTFSLGGTLLLLLIFMYCGGFTYFQGANFKIVLIILFVISLALNFCRLAIQWQKLRRNEELCIIPDYQNPKNIKPTQIILVCVVLLLLLTGYVVENLYWKGAWPICLGISALIAISERLSLTKRKC